MSKERSKEWISEAERDQLFQCEDIDTRDKMLMKTLYYGGLRISEALDIQKGDLLKEGDDCYILIKKQKTDKKNWEKQPIFTELYLDLIRYVKDYKIGRREYLFPSQMRDKMSRHRAYQVIRESAKKAGIDKNLTTHTFRRSIIMHLLDNGMHQIDVSRFVRHSSLSSIESYVKVSKKRLSKKIREVKLKYV